MSAGGRENERQAAKAAKVETPRIEKEFAQIVRTPVFR
jgi:hypothetical protein